MGGGGTHETNDAGAGPLLRRFGGEDDICGFALRVFEHAAVDCEERGEAGVGRVLPVDVVPVDSAWSRQHACGR